MHIGLRTDEVHAGRGTGMTRLAPRLFDLARFTTNNQQTSLQRERIKARSRFQHKSQTSHSALNNLHLRHQAMPNNISSPDNRVARWISRNLGNRIWRLRDTWWDFDYRNTLGELIVYHHLGLGDHFICMGLVLELANRYAKECVYLPVKRQNFDTVRTLYSGAKNVRVFAVNAATADNEIYGLARKRRARVARIGFGLHDPVNWDRSFYEQVGLDFDLSWRRFVPGDVEADSESLFRRLAPSRPYLLIHDAGSVGHFDLRLPPSGERVFVQPHQNPSGLLAWTKIIREATDIHCIDSSVVHLVDRMPDVPGQRLFLHDARHSGCTFTRHRPWQLILYPG